MKLTAWIMLAAILLSGCAETYIWDCENKFTRISVSADGDTVRTSGSEYNEWAGSEEDIEMSQKTFSRELVTTTGSGYTIYKRDNWHCIKQ